MSPWKLLLLKTRTISFEISYREATLCRKLIRNKWVRFKGWRWWKTNLIGHNNIYTYIDTYTCVWGRVTIHRLIFICKNTCIFLYYFLTGNSLSTWQSIIHYNGTTLHINLKGSHSFLAMRYWKVLQNNPFGHLETFWGVKRTICPTMLEKNELTPQHCCRRIHG